MLFMLLAGIWKTPVNKIGRQFSGYSSTCVVLLLFVFILGGREMVLLGTLTLILL